MDPEASRMGRSVESIMNNYARYLCREENVRDAMRMLDALSPDPQILLMVDADNRLLATLSDGDVRRFLIGGGKLDDAALDAANHRPKYAYTFQEAGHLYDPAQYILIPIVDCDRVVKGVYYGGANVQKDREALGLPVVINAGGKGTRLEPYTRVLPKPLIPVGEYPIIEHILRQFHGWGCDEFHLIVNYKRQLIKAYFAESEKGYRIHWHDEEAPLGTGGGLSLLRGSVAGTFIFTNCDILVRSDYRALLRFHRENHNVITMVCAYKNVQLPYGIIEMEKGGGIVSIQEKPELSFLTNTGMYVVEPEVLEDIPDSTVMGFPDIVEQQRSMGRRVAAFPVSENEWLDMGQPEELEKMRARLGGE